MDDLFVDDAAFTEEAPESVMAEITERTPGHSGRYFPPFANFTAASVNAWTNAAP